MISRLSIRPLQQSFLRYRQPFPSQVICLFSSTPKKMPQVPKNLRMHESQNDVMEDSNPMQQFWELKSGKKAPQLDQSGIANKAQTLEAEHLNESFKEIPMTSQELDHQEVKPKHTNCQGCGIFLQTENKQAAGYISRQRLQKALETEKMLKDNNMLEETEGFYGKDKEKALIEQLEQMGTPQQVIDEFQRQDTSKTKQGQPEILDIDSLLQLDQLQEQNQDLIPDKQLHRKLQQARNKITNSNLCERCRQLRFERNVISEEQRYGDAGTMLAPHVNAFDRGELMKQMRAKIFNRSIIIYVCDMTNFEGSIVPEILEMVEKDHHRLILVGNKIDAIPRNFKIDSLQLWVKRQIEPHFSDISSLDQFNICLTSAKKATGVQKIFTILEKTKKELQGMKLKYMPKVYVMGATNSGKSALINSMIYVQNKNKGIARMTKKKRGEQILLTEAALPGTTQEMITVEQLSVGFRVIDTPGIPSMDTVTSRVDSFQDLAKLLPSKEMTSLSLNVKAGYSLWLGALARLDLVSGDDKHLTCIVPQDVTIHRTPILKATTVFMNQAGKLLKPSYFKRSEDQGEGSAEKDAAVAEKVLDAMVKHEINLNCTSFKLANYDIVVNQFKRLCYR